MAASRALPTPPSPSFPSPTKSDSGLKANPHPYAIRTTSSGLLTRSNSSGYNIHVKHRYVPISPKTSRSESIKTHRSTQSLHSFNESPTTGGPRPLPAPPGLENGGYVSADDAPASNRRPRRGQTMPVIAVIEKQPDPFAAEELPSNPKLWTPTQLSNYLVTALRFSSAGKAGEADAVGLPAPIAKDIAAFIRSARIGGRTFLRLNEDDLAGMGMNKKWRDALLVASRNLRQNVLKGRIWGADPDLDLSPSSSPGSASPQIPEAVQVYANAQYNSSSSSVELSAGEEEDKSTWQNSVRPRRYRSGRVRGMVETFERSGSFSSEGSFDGNTEGDIADERTTLRRWLREEGKALPGQSPSPTRSEGRPLPAIPNVPPLPTPPASAYEPEVEEPTMEALLAEAEGGARGPWGARAWEEFDLQPGVTVKHVPDVNGLNGFALPAVAEEKLNTVVRLGSGKSSGGSSQGRPDRRVVTAIFAPSAPADEAAAEAPTIAADSFAAPAPAPAAAGVAAVEVIERMFEAEIERTRSLLETFRARLETVEQKVAEMEEAQAQAQAQDVPAAVEGESARPDVSEIPARPRGLEPVLELSEYATPEPESESDDDGKSSAVQLQTVIPEVVRRLRNPFARPDAARDVDTEDEQEPPPTSVADLPGYVLLVGLGVCAVVLQVVLKRVVGKGVVGGMKP